MDKYLEEYLKAHNLPFALYTHPPVFTVAQALPLTSHIPGLRSKNLFLKDGLGQFYLVCLPGYKTLNFKKLKKHLYLKDLTFASPLDLKQKLHLSPGSVSIFGMIYANDVTLILDQQLWNAPQVGFHPNENTATIVITHQTLERFLQTLSCRVEVIDIG